MKQLEVDRDVGGLWTPDGEEVSLVWCPKARAVVQADEECPICQNVNHKPVRVVITY